MKRIKLSVSDLPTDLLKAIFERLFLVDLVRAGAVSRTWYEVSSLCLECMMGKPKAPWLMWWGDDERFLSDEICCYANNFEESRKSYTIQGRWEEFDFDEVVGCSKGWLVILDIMRANPYLLNPFTKTQIKLSAIEEFEPSFIERVIDDFTSADGDLVVYDGNATLVRFSPRHAAEYLKPQAIVTVDMRNKVNGVLMRFLWSISYWRRRDERCFSMKREKRSPEPWYMMLEDNKLYVLNSSWNIEIWEFCACDGTFERLREIINAGPYPEFPIRDDSMIEVEYMIKYMVRLETGEVLIAVRFIELCSEKLSMNHWWELYKMKMDIGKWEKVQELEEYAVFLGHNEPMVLLAEQLNGCKGNAIYYTHDHESSKGYIKSLYGGGWFDDEDMGILDLHTLTIENFSTLRSANAAVWIVPNFCE